MVEHSVSISGLDRGAVLAALYNAAAPRGMGFLKYEHHFMTAEEANEILSKETYFDYLKGRPMGLTLKSDIIYPGGYDMDNGGEGTAKNIINSLRQDPSAVASLSIKQSHFQKTLLAIEEVLPQLGISSSCGIKEIPVGGDVEFIQTVRLDLKYAAVPLSVAIMK